MKGDIEFMVDQQATQIPADTESWQHTDDVEDA